MSKRLPRRKFIGQMKQLEIWVSEDEMQEDLQIIEKLHPGEINDAIQALVDRGFINVRLTPDGKREFRFNQSTVQAAINALPKRNGEVGR